MKIYKTLAKQSIHCSLNELIQQLKEWKTKFKKWDTLNVETDSEWEYGDSYIYLFLKGTREETKEEEEKRKLRKEHYKKEKREMLERELAKLS